LWHSGTVYEAAGAGAVVAGGAVVGAGVEAGVVYGQGSAVFSCQIRLPLSRVSVQYSLGVSLGRSVGSGLGLKVLQLAVVRCVEGSNWTLVSSQEYCKRK